MRNHPLASHSPSNLKMASFYLPNLSTSSPIPWHNLETIYSLQTPILRKVEKAKSILKTHLTKLSLELQRPWTEFLPMALARIRVTPRALSFLSPFELMYGCPFLLGQFPTESPLLGEYLPTLNLIRALVREHADHSLPKPHQTNPADLTLILGVLLKTLYYKALQPQLTGPFEVVLTIPQLLNWHVFTHRFVKMKVKVAQSCLTLCDHRK